MEAQVTTNVVVAISGFIGIIALLFLTITRYKWHVFIAMLVPIVLFALLPTVDIDTFIEAFETGFGSTVQSIAVVIVLGSLIAESLRHSGGVERVTLSMVKFVGSKRMPLALTLAGFVIGIAIFSDIGYIILNPLVHGAAIAGGTNMATMGTGLVGSLQLTHALVPPTPGPLAAAAILDADIGLVILWGSIVTLIASLAGWLFAKLVGPKLPSPPSTEFVGESFAEQGREHELPSTMWSYAPIIVPLLLIAAQSVGVFLLPDDNPVNLVLKYLGWPVVALGIGVLLAYRSTRKKEDKENRRNTWVEEALRMSAMIIMVTGLGGALSEILKATPAVDTIADAVVSSGVPVIFLPFVLGIVGNIITGSTTVGVITAASLTAPLAAQFGLGPEAAMLAGASGSVIVKYVNSSYFWVATSFSRMPLRSALFAYGGVTLVGGVVSMAVVYVLWATGIL